MGRRSLALVAVFTGAAPLAAQHRAVIAGRVSEAESHRPVASAQIQLTDFPRVTFTDDRGVFRLTDVPTGAHGLLIRAIGYRPIQVDVTLEAGDTVEIDSSILALTPVAVELPGVLVRSDSLQIAALTLTGFYERRGRGFGTFAERDEITRWRPHALSDVLRHLPGVRIVANPNYGHTGSRVDLRPYLIELRGCRNIMFFLNGTSLGSSADPIFDLDLVADARDITAVEVYRGPSEIPLQFNATNSVCGVVVLWTER
jgi:Carboxypeptidase regulatory-like domain/TonB-dependent Receptor Plug Domain